MKGQVAGGRDLHGLFQGPAQTAGVMVGWFLDMGALLQEDERGWSLLVSGLVYESGGICLTFPWLVFYDS